MQKSLHETLSLSEKHLGLIQRLLSAFVPGREVRAFGSRVKGTSRMHSDLDLVVMGEEPLDWEDIGGLRNALTESYLPIRVDVAEWARTSPEFRDIIAAKNVVIQPGSETPVKTA